MKYKRKTHVLHEINQKIQGDEPFLNFIHPWMIVNLNGGPRGSHNFFEGHSDSMSKLFPGDTLRFQVQRVSLVPMKWYERVWVWIKERI
jgi:hypothetical protein